MRGVFLLAVLAAFVASSSAQDDCAVVKAQCAESCAVKNMTAVSNWCTVTPVGVLHGCICAAFPGDDAAVDETDEMAISSDAAAAEMEILSDIVQSSNDEATKVSTEVEVSSDSQGSAQATVSSSTKMPCHEDGQGSSSSQQGPSSEMALLNTLFGRRMGPMPLPFLPMPSMMLPAAPGAAADPFAAARMAFLARAMNQQMQAPRITIVRLVPSEHFEERMEAAAAQQEVLQREAQHQAEAESTVQAGFACVAALLTGLFFAVAVSCCCCGASLRRQRGAAAMKTADVIVVEADDEIDMPLLVDDVDSEAEPSMLVVLSNKA